MQQIDFFHLWSEATSPSNPDPDRPLSHSAPPPPPPTPSSALPPTAARRARAEARTTITESSWVSTTTPSNQGHRPDLRGVTGRARLPVRGQQHQQPKQQQQQQQHQRQTKLPSPSPLARYAQLCVAAMAGRTPVAEIAGARAGG